MGKLKEMYPSDQDNYVIFLTPKSAKLSPSTSYVGRQIQQKQRWLLVLGVCLSLAMAALSVFVVYNMYRYSYFEELQNAHSFVHTGTPAPTELENIEVAQIKIHVDEIDFSPDFPIPIQDKKPDLVLHFEKNKAHIPIKLQASCQITREVDRFDCFPLPNSSSPSQDSCLKRGCCWNDQVQEGAPFCYYPTDYPTYTIDSKEDTDLGFSLRMSRSNPSGWPDDVNLLRMDVSYETNNRLRLRIFDPGNQRYEVPIDVPMVTTPAANPSYVITVPDVGESFSVTVKRPSGSVLFDTSGGVPLMFADQYIQLSTKLGSKYLYGLGEHRDALTHNLNWTIYSFWARDQAPELNMNLYGDHPFYMSIGADGLVYGVFLLNSNAMQVNLQLAPALTYKTIGGILDFYVFTGPTPDDVIQQYTDVIGKPFMPPYWSLGFHLCRYGYGSSEELKKVIKRMRDAKFPYDTQWTDIDYMRNYLDWTFDDDRFSDLPAIVQDLRDNGQHYIMIVDPGISNTQFTGTYPPYDEGIRDGVFVMKGDGSGPLVGKVWPGNTVYPDFFHPAAFDWWYNQAERFFIQIQFEGMWIDMNEPSNFVRGSISGCPTNSSLNNPPFIPGVVGGTLISNTICPSAQHNISSHYNLHSLYGHSEAKISHFVLKELLLKRSIVISRSTFPSTGHYAGHWLGDNISEWPDLYYSIPAMLSFQFFGIPMVGADICGFRGSTTPELCTRWMQLGAFYPFMRNHNAINSPDQDPAVFDSATQAAMKKALIARYTMLPYLYTLFYFSHVYGSAVARPLMYDMSSSKTYTIDKQFYWGDKLLISPVLNQGFTTVSAYFREGAWYDYYKGAKVEGRGDYITLDAPIDTINLHIRGGAIIPTQDYNVTTYLSRRQKFGLLVGLSETGEADGELFWDDGDSIGTILAKKYTFLKFKANANMLTSSVVESGFAPFLGMTLGQFRIMGLNSTPSNVTANGLSVAFHYNTALHYMDVINLSLNMLKPIKIIWT